MRSQVLMHEKRTRWTYPSRPLPNAISFRMLRIHSSSSSPGCTTAEDSVGFLGLLEGSSKPLRETLVVRVFSGNLSIRQGHWKLSASLRSGQFRLFKLSNDISEQTNLYKSHPEKGDRIVRGHCNDLPRWPKHAWCVPKERSSSLMGSSRVDKQRIECSNANTSSRSEFDLAQFTTGIRNAIHCVDASSFACSSS